MSELEQYVSGFVTDLETLNASLDYWLERGRQEHRELMALIEELEEIRASNVFRRDGTWHVDGSL